MPTQQYLGYEWLDFHLETFWKWKADYATHLLHIMCIVPSNFLLRSQVKAATTRSLPKAKSTEKLVQGCPPLKDAVVGEVRFALGRVRIMGAILYYRECLRIHVLLPCELSGAISISI